MTQKEAKDFVKKCDKKNPEVWKIPTDTRGENDDHNLAMAICTMGDWHIRPLAQGKKQVKFLLVAIKYFTK